MVVKAPVFSIVIPTFNRAQLISKTLESIVKQDFKDFEVLVIDDGGSDNTEEIVKVYSDPRLLYFRKNNGERGAARNYGASLAKGEYLNFCDSDDLMYPNHLSFALQFLNSQSSPEIFHLSYDFQGLDGRVIKVINDFSGQIQKDVLFNNRLSCNCVFLRKDIALRFPFEEDRILASSEDWELCIRLACRYKLHSSDVVTSSVVNHDQRSLFTISAQKIVARDLLLIKKLQTDDVVMNVYKGSFKRFIADRYTFFMLCLAEQKQNFQVWQWAFKAIGIYPLTFFSKRFLASIKNSLLP